MKPAACSCRVSTSLIFERGVTKGSDLLVAGPARRCCGDPPLGESSWQRGVPFRANGKLIAEAHWFATGTAVETEVNARFKTA